MSKYTEVLNDERWIKKRETLIQSRGGHCENCGRDDIAECKLKLGQIKTRLDGIADAYLDKVFDADTFKAKRSALLMEQKEVEESLAKIENPHDVEAELTDFVSFASNLSLVFEVAEPKEKRRILGLVTKKREIRGRDLIIELSPGFREIAARYAEESQTNHGQRSGLFARTREKLG
jgi:hypothetical protein